MPNLSEITIDTILSDSTLIQQLEGNLSSLVIKNLDTNLTYTLAINERQDSGIIPLKVTDSSGNFVENINCQQEISPDTPTEINYLPSLQNVNGVTYAKALGKNLYNSDTRPNGS